MNKYKEQGMSLIEIMIVVSIVAIIAAVALPAYQDQTQKTRRAKGTAMLAEVLNAQEKYYTINSTYSVDLRDIGYPAITVDTDDGFYTLVSEACGGSTIDSCVTITGMANGSQASYGNISVSSSDPDNIDLDAAAVTIPP